MALLTVNGGIRATGDVTAFYSSDGRLKENIISIPSALEKLGGLRGVSFDWVENASELLGEFDGYFGRQGNHGVIAQELEAVLPEAIRDRPPNAQGTSYKAVEYLAVVALLIEGVKELHGQVQSLEARVQTLESAE